MARASVRLDDKTAKSLSGPAPGGFDVVHWDDKLSGFGLRVLASGRRNWVVRYRVGRKQRVVGLGTTDELRAAKAREEAARILSQRNLGHDERVSIERRKVEAAKPAALTVSDLIEAYLAQVERSQRPRTFKETTRHLRVDAKPLHGEPADTLSRRTVAQLLMTMVNEGRPVASNRTRSCLSACFVWGMKQGLVETNPVAGTAKLGHEKPRERVLTTEELKAIWLATDDTSDHSRIVRLLMLTGARREEIAGIVWPELNLGQSEWTLPAERSKNKRPHLVPLSEPALTILSSVEVRDKRELLFGEGEGPFSGWSRCKERLDGRITRQRAKERLGRPLRKDEKPEPADALPHWTLHDLRRTVATMMADKLAVQPHIVEAVLNHQSGTKGGIAGVYNRAVYASEKRQALNKWAEWLVRS